MAWGIVTNKSEHLARLLLDKLGMSKRMCCIVGGDSTGHLKPHPRSRARGVPVRDAEPGCCVYVGDDRRDIDAGRAAGTRTAAAKWGYLNGGKPDEWGADWLLEQPEHLLRFL
jgi:phosphoglycolate phosphatase